MLKGKFGRWLIIAIIFKYFFKKYKNIMSLKHFKAKQEQNRDLLKSVDAYITWKNRVKMTFGSEPLIYSEFIELRS